MRLSQTTVVHSEGIAQLNCTVVSGGGIYQLLIQVPEEYDRFLVHEVSDPFIIAVMLPSLMLGEDIECENISFRTEKPNSLSIV